MRWMFGVAAGALALACGSSTNGTAAHAGSGGAAGAGVGVGGTAGGLASAGRSGAAAAGSGGSSSGGAGSGGANSGGANSGAAGSAGSTPVLSGSSALIALGLNDRCWPDSVLLPTADGGATEPACRIVLTGVTGGCTQPGLSAASAQDQASVEAGAHAIGETMVEEPLCQLAELSTSSGAECVAASASGWCFVDGACTSTQRACNHALCTSTTFSQLMIAYQLPSWIVCD